MTKKASLLLKDVLSEMMGKKKENSDSSCFAGDKETDVHDIVLDVHDPVTMLRAQITIRLAVIDGDDQAWEHAKARMQTEDKTTLLRLAQEGDQAFVRLIDMLADRARRVMEESVQ